MTEVMNLKIISMNLIKLLIVMKLLLILTRYCIVYFINKILFPIIQVNIVFMILIFYVDLRLNINDQNHEDDIRLNDWKQNVVNKINDAEKKIASLVIIHMLMVVLYPLLISCLIFY